MDYGLKHVLGNLLSDSYESLFLSPEFRRIKAGTENEEIDILCRTCEDFAYRQSFLTKIAKKATFKNAQSASLDRGT
jgi:hypothetical protein